MKSFTLIAAFILLISSFISVVEGTFRLLNAEVGIAILLFALFVFLLIIGYLFLKYSVKLAVQYEKKVNR